MRNSILQHFVVESQAWNHSLNVQVELMNLLLEFLINVKFCHAESPGYPKARSRDPQLGCELQAFRVRKS